MKSENTVLKQDFNATSMIGEATISAVPDVRPVAPSLTRKTVFDTLIPETLQKKSILIPAELVALHAINLPVRSVRQKYDALPFALEGAIATSLNDTSFALCGAAPDGKTLAATLAHQTLDAFTLAHPNIPLIPEHMVIEPPSPTDDGQDVWRIYRIGQRVLVRFSDGTGAALHCDMIAHLWHLAGRPVVENYGAALPRDVASQDLSKTPVPIDKHLKDIDLRQGKHAPDRGFARPLKVLAAFTFLAVIGHFIIAGVDTRARVRLADTLGADATLALAPRLPTASRDDPPALIQRQFTAQSQPREGSDFLPLMDHISKALLGQDGTIQFRQLRWVNGTIRLTIEAPDLDTLQKAEAQLISDGLRVTSGSATADAGAARVEMTVQR